MSSTVVTKVWLTDCEWTYLDGRINYPTSWEPVVFCLEEFSSLERHSFWGRDHGLYAFMEDHKNDLFVSHFNVTEMKYLLRLNINLPARWWDTFTGWRVLTNAPDNLEASLLSALDKLGLPHISPAQKDDIRERILNPRGFIQSINHPVYQMLTEGEEIVL